METAGLEFHLWEGKAIFILKSALPLENLKVYVKLLKGHQGQDQDQGQEAMASIPSVKLQAWDYLIL